MCKLQAGGIFRMHAAQADEAAQEVVPEALGPEAAMSNATVSPHEAAPACPTIPEAPNGPCAHGFGPLGRMAGPSMAAVAGLVSGSAESTLHVPAEPQLAQWEPERAQAGPDWAQAGLLADAHAAPAPLTAPVQLVASSMVRGPCNPSIADS